MTDPDDSALPPGQAGFRLLIELTAIICWGIVGWQIADGALRWVLVVLFPLVAAIIWGTFRVPADHSASGNAPIPVPGVVRLLLEIDVLLGAAIVTAIVWRPAVGIVLAGAVVLHYVTTLHRVRWLIGQRPGDAAPRAR